MNKHLQQDQSLLGEGDLVAMENTANSFEFFLPSPELAEALVAQNQALVSDYARMMNLETEMQEEAEDRSLLGGLVSGLRPNRARESQSRSTEMARRVIAERLYHYVSSLSETPFALAGGEFPVHEYIADGMGTMLGLSAYRKQPDSARSREIRQLLERLTSEFQDWLIDKQKGKFVTPWLEMHLDARGQLRLLLIAEDEEQVEEGLLQSATVGSPEYISVANEPEPERVWDVSSGPTAPKYGGIQYYSGKGIGKGLTVGIAGDKVSKTHDEKDKHDRAVSNESRASQAKESAS
jgi:hypothetical protein